MLHWSEGSEKRKRWPLEIYSYNALLHGSPFPDPVLATQDQLWLTTFWCQVCRGNRSVCSHLLSAVHWRAIKAGCLHINITWKVSLTGKKCTGFVSWSKCCQKWVSWKKECKIPQWYHSTENQEKVITWYMSKGDSVIPDVSAMFNKYPVISLKFTVHNTRLIFVFLKIYGLFTFPMQPSPCERALNVEKITAAPLPLVFLMCLCLNAACLLPSPALPHCPVSSQIIYIS